MTSLNKCKNCIHLVKYYGKKDSKGNRVMSRYKCVKRDAFMKHFPKKCEQMEERRDR